LGSFDEGTKGMQVHRNAVEITIHTPAKLNLFFEVLAKRADGYHEIETLMCPIDLYDTLYFREEPSGRLEFECQWAHLPGEHGSAGFEQIPTGPENLVVRAVELVRRHKAANRGASLRLVKRIPAAAGLGGGSSDAAAALVASNTGWDFGLLPEELARLAAELGSDVPFFLTRGSAVCRGRGERVEPVPGLGALHFVVVRPPEGLATVAVYGACRPADEPRPLAPLVEAFQQGDLGQAGRLLFNRLQPAAERLSPWVARLRNMFAALDCLGHSMSGSGTSYFGLCRHARHARRIARRLRGEGAGSVFAVRSC
jgi:4-diphosphocytidyl-2-C-methyl-D-erythritol kinase